MLCYALHSFISKLGVIAGVYSSYQPTIITIKNLNVRACVIILFRLVEMTVFDSFFNILIKATTGVTRSLTLDTDGY